jgi:hypothetical protein
MAPLKVETATGKSDVNIHQLANKRQAHLR